MSSDVARSVPHAPPFLVQRLVGDLLGVRVGPLGVVADVINLSAALRRAAETGAGPVVICADYRRLQVMHPEVASALVAEFRRLNSSVRRSAIIMPNNAPAIRLQMERLLREAQHPGRRVCVDAAEVKAWLSSDLNGPEQRGLEAFLVASDADEDDTHRRRGRRGSL